LLFALIACLFILYYRIISYRIKRR